MRKIFIVLAAILVTLVGCNKKEDISQLRFSFYNLTTLIGQSASYIMEASPGIYREDASGLYLLAFEVDDIDTLGNLDLGYRLESNICYKISLVSDSGKLEIVDHFLQLAERDFFNGEFYGLSYIDEAQQSQQETFDTYEALVDFIADYGLTEADVIEMVAVYESNNMQVYISGFATEEVFSPAVLIQADPTKKGILQAKDMKEIMSTVRTNISRFSE